jgi:molybdopterin-guanine dinucleotide biosynthesis protein A
MNTDKASIVWRGETLAARAGRVLASVCDPVVEVGAGVSGLPGLREDPPGSGPLAALVAGVRALAPAGLDARPVVLLACDLPFVEPPVLRLLADWPGAPTVIPIVDGRLQFVCARYGRDALERAAAALLAGEQALRILADTDHDELGAERWSAVGPPETFSDVDTPEDMLRLGLS